jgi:glycosyltransferase involved in cell wall biosynthesis
MDVCHLVNSLSRGGVQTLLLDIVHESPPDVSYTVGYFETGDALVSDLEAAGARVVHFNAVFKFDPRAVWRLVRFLRANRFDIVHAHLLQAQVLARLASRVSDTGAVISTHHNVPREYHPVTHFLEGITRLLDDATVAVSNGVRDAVSSDRYFRAAEWHTIYNGLDVEGFRREVESATPLASTDGLTFLNVARYVPAKSQRDLVAAMDRVVTERPDDQLYIVGDGPLEEELHAAVAEYGLEDSVYVTGPVDDIHGYYATADVFVASSLWEGLPMVMIEAMAAGLPVVATDIPGLREIVVDGEAGRLVPPSSPPALAEAMCSMADADLRDEFGTRGYETVRREFEITENIRKYVELYRDCSGVLGSTEQ